MANRNFMELTITQDGALYALQHGANKKYRRVRSRRVGGDLTRLLPTLTTSMEKLAKHPIPTDNGSVRATIDGAQVADSFPQYRVAA